MILYKVLDDKGRPYHGGKGKWSLPENGNPGAWMPEIPELVPCKSGYHLCRRQDLIRWLGPIIYTAEARGNLLEQEYKIVASSARLLRRVDTWNERSARQLTADWAEYLAKLADIEEDDFDYVLRTARSCGHYPGLHRLQYSREIARARALARPGLDLQPSPVRRAWAAAWRSVLDDPLGGLGAVFTHANPSEITWLTNKLMAYLKE